MSLSQPRADALSNLGNLYLNQGRTRQARQSIEQALAFQPDHADALNHWGRLLSAEGDYVGALSAFEAAIETEPSFATAHFNRGRLLHAQGKRSAAGPRDSRVSGRHYEPRGQRSYRGKRQPYSS